MASLEASDSLAASKLSTLCTDLDGTLLKTDSLIESLLALLQQKPCYVLFLPFWLLKGRAHLKQQIARHVTLDVTSLPYHPELLAYLIQQHRAGREIILATGADMTIARLVAKHLGIFSTVLATNGKTNLTGFKKLQLIKEYVGQADFVYAGNSKIDLPIWQCSKNAILVNAPNRLVQRLRKGVAVIHAFRDRKSSTWAFIKAIRVHQWVKNLLVFIPLVAGHQITNSARFFDALMAFVAFSLCSSGAYIVNDLLDLEADRRHPTKKHRPFAAGDLPLKIALIAPPFFCLAGLGLSWLLSFQLTATLSIYFILTLLYSFFIKRLVLVDVFLLASLYTLRIIGGGAATQIPISNWLLLFSLFLFLSLAFLKRFSELQKLRREGQHLIKSRGYLVVDVEQLASLGSASGYITALVLALYINSDDVKILYRRPEILWFICPLILYWISRAWLVARRGQMNDDPVVFAIKDMSTYVIAILAAVTFLLATG